MKTRLMLASCLLVVASPRLARAMTVDAGGPYRVAEGSEIVLVPIVSDAVGDPSYAWDLDLDGVFDDSLQETAIFSAVGMDGPTSGSVNLIVTDDVEDVFVEVTIDVSNAPPIFVSVPEPDATVGVEWSYTIAVIDPGDDAFEVSLVDADTLPAGMVFDAVVPELLWTPAEPGDVVFSIAAEDDDLGRSRQEITIHVAGGAGDGDADADADADADEDGDTDADADADGDTDADADADADGDTDADGDADADGDTDADADGDADGDDGDEGGGCGCHARGTPSFGLVLVGLLGLALRRRTLRAPRS